MQRAGGASGRGSGPTGTFTPGDKAGLGRCGQTASLTAVGGADQNYKCQRHLQDRCTRRNVSCPVPEHMGPRVYSSQHPPFVSHGAAAEVAPLSVESRAQRSPGWRGMCGGPAPAQRPRRVFSVLLPACTEPSDVMSAQCFPPFRRWPPHCPRVTHRVLTF